MATAQQIADWANGAEQRGIIPHRPIGPPDWQAKGALLSFMVVQGFSNRHDGQLPPSDRAFLEWAASRDRVFGTQRYWPAGSRDVKTDGTSDPAPWDWNPLGCPGGAGCNDGDWMNHAPWPASPVGIVPGAPPPAAGAVGGGGGGGRSVAPIVGGGSRTITLPGIGQVDTLVLAAAGVGVGVLLLARGRR